MVSENSADQKHYFGDHFYFDLKLLIRNIQIMKNDPAIDFTKYSDNELLSSLASINSDKFANNYEACKSEIEKRKTNGIWGINDEKDKQESLLKSRKIVKVFALIQSVSGVLGIGNYLYIYGPHLFTGDVSFINWILILVVLALFAITSLVAWKYWRTEKDNKGLWWFMISLQVPSFCISGFGYEFYCGFKIPVGIANGQFGISASFGSNIALFWNEGAPFSLSVNIAALILLALLTKAELFDSKTPRTI